VTKIAIANFLLAISRRRINICLADKTTRQLHFVLGS
jgi:hypothetical protein